MNVAFFVLSGAMLVSGIVWLLGMKYLALETATVQAQPAPKSETAGATHGRSCR